MKTILLIVSLLAVAAFAHAADANAVETASTIPDLKLRVQSVKRPDNKHVIFVIQAVADDKARGDVHLETSVRPAPKNATKEDIASGKYEARGFTLLPAEMIDEATGQKYSSVELPPGLPFLGPSKIRISLEPGSSVQMAICLASPAPLPADASGKPPEQKVTLILPNTLKPIKGLVLPPTVDSPKKP